MTTEQQQLADLQEVYEAAKELFDKLMGSDQDATYEAMTAFKYRRNAFDYKYPSIAQQPFPERWALKCENEEEAKEFLEWVIKNNETGAAYSSNEFKIQYFNFPLVNGWHLHSEVQPSHTPITFTQWKQHYYPEKVEGKEDEQESWDIIFQKYATDVYLDLDEVRYFFIPFLNWLKKNHPISTTQSEVEQTQEQQLKDLQELGKAAIDYANAINNIVTFKNLINIAKAYESKYPSTPNN